jgi:MFS family permease
MVESLPPGPTGGRYYRDPMPGEAGSAAPSARDLVRLRSPAAFLVIVVVSTMAAVAQITALGKLVFDLTGSELDLGLLGLAEFIPAALLVPISGTIADRFDRRFVMGLGLLGETVCAATLAFVAHRGVETIAPLLALVVGFGTFRAIAAPATRALPVTLVPRGGLPPMVALFSGAWQVGAIVGPVLAGVLFLVSPTASFAATSVLLAIGAAMVPLIRLHPDAEVRDPEGPPPRLSEALDGLRLVWRTPLLLGAISLDLFAVLFGGAVALLPALAEDRLGVDAAGLGLLRAAVGLGAAVTTAALAIRPLRRHIGTTLLTAVAIFGAATILLGTTRSFVVALGALLVASGADAISVFVRATLVPLITPDRFRGRVLAVENVFIGASNELGAFESGVAGQFLGAAGSVVLGGAATLVVVAVWAFAFPALRRVDSFDGVEPAPGPD